MSETRKFLKSSIAVLVIANTASLVNYVVQVVTTRSLVPEDYAIVGSVTSLGPTLFSIFAIIPQLVSKAIIELDHNHVAQALLIKKLNRSILIVSSILVVGFCFASPVIASYLNLDSVVPILIYSISVYLSIFVLYFTGKLHGYLLFLPVSIKDLINAILKLVFVVLFVVILPLSFLGALIAEAVALVIVAISIGLYVHKQDLSHNYGADEHKEGDPAEYKVVLPGILKIAIPVALVSWISGLLISVDVNLAKHFLDAAEAGSYAAASSLGRVSFYFSGSLGIILFPKVIKNQGQGKSSKKDLLVILGITLITSSLISLIISLFSQEILTLLYGEAYSGASSILIIIAWSMTLLSSCTVLFNFMVAKNFLEFLIPSGLALFSLLVIINVFLNNSAEEIAFGMLVGTGLMFLSNGLVVFLRSAGVIKNRSKV